MSKARDLANAGTALTTVSATELGYLDGVTSAVQTQINAQIPKSTVTTKGDLLVATGSGTVIRQGVGTDGQFLQAASEQADGVQWATVSQYALPTQTGNSGKFLTTNGTSESWGTVTSPIVWTLRQIETSSTIYKIEYNGSNLWVAVGSNGKLWSSPNATTWTSRTSQFGTDRIVDVAFANGLWVAVGQNGKISTSTDGITWTSRTSNMSTNEIRSVIYANSLWVAVGDGGGGTNTGGIIYSSDGITWTRKSQTTNSGSTYYDVTWNGTNWVVGADLDSSNFLYASTPSGSWTTGLTNSSGEVSRIIWDGTRHITAERGPFNSLRNSTSTTLGSTTAYPYTPGAGGTYKGWVYFYNGEIYVSNGVYWQIMSPNPSLPSRTIPNFVPGIVGTRDGSGNPNINSQPVAIWAGSQGIIMATGLGIHTSF